MNLGISIRASNPHGLSSVEEISSGFLQSVQLSEEEVRMLAAFRRRKLNAPLHWGSVMFEWLTSGDPGVISKEPGLIRDPREG